MSYIRINNLKKKSYLIFQERTTFFDCSFRKGTLVEIIEINEFAYNKVVYVNFKHKNKFFSIELNKLSNQKIYIEGKLFSLK